MDAVSILFALGLAVLVGVFIAGPLLGDRRGATSVADDSASDLIVEREAVLTALRELDFDHAMAKVADEDYASQRASLMARGITLLQQLDALMENPANSAEAQLEAEVRAVRVQHPSKTK
jgi:hypothetical protein